MGSNDEDGENGESSRKFLRSGEEKQKINCERKSIKSCSSLNLKERNKIESEKSKVNYQNESDSKNIVDFESEICSRENVDLKSESNSIKIINLESKKDSRRNVNFENKSDSKNIVDFENEIFSRENVDLKSESNSIKIISFESKKDSKRNVNFENESSSRKVVDFESETTKKIYLKNETTREKYFLKNKKSGFTIVELVIVVAIIVILSSVLIPTFIGLISRAELENTKKNVKNLNTILITERANFENKKSSNNLIKTYSYSKEENELNRTSLSVEDAIEIISNNGISETNLVEESEKYDILYSEEIGQFAVAMKDKNENMNYFTGTSCEISNDNQNETLWKFYNKKSLKIGEKYSIFIVGNDNFAEIVVDGVNFNAGKNENISEIKYINTSKNSNKIKIKTNGGDLKINTDYDDISHYGESKNVEIFLFSGKEFIENGEVEEINLQQGILTIGENSNVEKVNFVQNLSTETELTAFKDIQVNILKNANLPNFNCKNIVVFGINGLFIAKIGIECENKILLFDLKIYSDNLKSLTPEKEIETEKYADVLNEIYKNLENITVKTKMMLNVI